MCTTAYVDGESVSTVGELKAAIGSANVFPRRDGLDADGFCLCNVDLPRSAAAVGMSVASDPIGDVCLMRPGQRYVIRCRDCGLTWDVADHETDWNHMHGGSRRSTGPTLVNE